MHISENILRSPTSSPKNRFFFALFETIPTDQQVVMVKHFLLLTAFAASGFGVNLVNYERSNCNGPSRACTNIAANTCCRSPTRTFHGGICEGCTATDFHVVYTRRGNEDCYRARDATNGRRCISYYGPLRGHKYCRLCGTELLVESQDPSETTNTTEPACTASVNPDVGSKDGINYYRIGAGVPEEDNHAIERWLDDETTTTGLSEALREKYKVSYKPGTPSD